MGFLGDINKDGKRNSIRPASAPPPPAAFAAKGMIEDSAPGSARSFPPDKLPSGSGVQSLDPDALLDAGLSPIFVQMASEHHEPAGPQDTNEPGNPSIKVPEVLPSATANPEKSRKRWAAAVGVVATAIGIGILGTGFIRGEKKIVQPIIEGCGSPNVCMLDKTPKDCDLKTGQPFGMYFDTSLSCGFCGQTDDKGRYVKQPWMTMADCPIVFACGDDQVQKGVAYGGVYKKDVEGNFIASVAVLNECDKKDPGYCAKDCEGRKVSSKATKPAPESVDSAEPIIEASPAPGMIICERKVVGGVPVPSVLDGALSRRIIGVVTNHASEIRNALGKTDSEEVMVTVGLTIDSMGRATIVSITAGGQDLMWLVTIDLSGVPVPTPESNCKGTISVRISAE